MKKGILLLIGFVALYINANAQYVSLSNAEFAKLKQLVNTDADAKKAFEPFQATAKTALTEQPNPIEEITSEGMLAGNPDKIKSLKAVEDADKIYALALIYKVENDKACIDKAVEYLLAWARVNKASGDPIDETKLESLYAGYDMIRSDINANAKNQIDSWLKTVADGELYSEYAKGDKGTAINNWNSHRLKIIAMIAYAVHDGKYDKLLQQEMAKQIAINLYPDGTGYDFKERDAFHYHIYNLEPLLTAATVIYRATGKDYFNYQSPTGSSIKKSIDFMVPYVTGEKTHGEFLNSNVPFDKARAKNGEKDYQAGALFKPLTGVHVLEQASYFSGKYLAVVKKVVPADSDLKFDWELVLNKVRKPSGLN